MGNLNTLFNTRQKEITISRVTGFGSSGEFKVSVSGTIRRVTSTITENIKIGDTVLLNKTPHGKYYIVGITSGLSNSKNVMEIIKYG
jgi:ferredoxin-NADP reductase